MTDPQGTSRRNYSNWLLVFLLFVVAILLLVQLDLVQLPIEAKPVQVQLGGPIIGGTERANPPELSTLALHKVTSELPTSPVGKQLNWTLEKLNQNQPLTQSEVATHFAPIIFENMTIDEMIYEFQFLSEKHRPCELIGFLAPPTEHSLTTALKLSNGHFHILTIAVEPQEPHRLNHLVIRTWR